MELVKGIETRRSFRAFKSTPIPRDTIEMILKTAGRSPSYTNTQPWEVAVVSGKKKEDLCNILYNLAKNDAPTNPETSLPKKWPEALATRSRAHRTKRLRTLGIEPDDAAGNKELRLLNFKFYGAPCALFLFIDRDLGEWSIFDMGLFAQSVILAAHSFGLGCCLQAMLAAYPDAVRQCLDIPNSKKLVIGISIGYPDPEARINTYHSDRISPEDFVRWYA